MARKLREMVEIRPQWLPEIPDDVSTDEYVRLRREQVCQECGLKRVRGPGGEFDDQDPCIANLPGVVAACCGHGAWESYALFTNGKIIRGKFDHMPEIPEDVLQMMKAGEIDEDGN